MRIIVAGRDTRASRMSYQILNKYDSQMEAETETLPLWEVHCDMLRLTIGQLCANK